MYISDMELRRMKKYFRASNYLGAAQMYLMDNPLLRRKLEIGDVITYQTEFGERNYQVVTNEIIIETDHIIKIRNKLNKLLAKNTNKSIKKIEEDTKRDHYMSAEEATKYGIVDKIIKNSH